MPADGGTFSADAAPDPSDAALDGSSAAADGGPPFTVSIVSPTSPVVASDGTILVRAFVDGATPGLVTLRLDGEPLASIAPPFEHTLDVATLSEAEHQVVASATADGVTVESEPLVVLVDRTAPSVVTIDPPVTDNYRLGDRVTVTFDEAIDPDSVNAPSTGLANGAGDAFTSTLELDPLGTMLTITPTAPNMVADGTVEVALGVTDAAGNALMPFAASWAAPRWIPVGRAIPLAAMEQFEGDDLALRVASSGELFVAGLVEDYSVPGSTYFVRVARLDGTGWTVLGDRVCESASIRPFPSPIAGSWDFELEPDDTPVVAVRDLSDPSAPSVRFCRFSGSSWVEEPTTFAEAQVLQFDFDIGPTGDRVLLADVGTATTSVDYVTPETWERPIGGSWSYVSSSERPEHEENWISHVEYDRLGRITQLLSLGGTYRRLGHLDSGTFVREAITSRAGPRARLVETATTRTMETGCELLEPGDSTLTRLYSVPYGECDLVAGEVTERRLLAYCDGDRHLGLALETSRGVFEDLGAQPVHATRSGVSCDPAAPDCERPVDEVSLTVVGPRVIAVVTGGLAFDLNTLGTVP